MKKETLLSILEFSKMFFGVGIIFTYILANSHRNEMIIANIILYIISIIFYNKVK